MSFESLIPVPLWLQSVVTRVASLPLVSSTYDFVSSAYISTKDQHPYLRSVCEMAEKGVKTVTSVAVTSALPIIQRLEPQSEFSFPLNPRAGCVLSNAREPFCLPEAQCRLVSSIHTEGLPLSVASHHNS